MFRRDFIKISAALGTLPIVPWFSYANSTAARNPLPIPGLITPSSKDQVQLTLQSGSMNWVANKATKTFGINGPLLGPAIKVKRGQQFSVKINNQLPEQSVIHYHGLEVPGVVDGGPTEPLAAGASKASILNIDQRAATCWFHTHPCGRTGYQTAMGIAGLMIIEDENSSQLTLPTTWGVDDIPVVMQDKRLDNNGQISYHLNEMTTAVGWIGNHMFVNGAAYPQHNAPRGWVRLRLLNGCNARALTITTSDQRSMFVIASDGGFLSEPVEVKQLDVLMGERFEVLVNTADAKAFDLVMLPTKQDGMNLAPFDQPLPILTIQPTKQQGVTKLPEQLVAVPQLVVPTRIKTRRLELMMDNSTHLAHSKVLQNPALLDMPSKMSHHEIMHLNKINGKAYDMHKPLFDVKQGVFERWIISGAMDTMLHPFHVHGTQFRIILENGKKPLAHRSGWKDTVRVEGLRSEILVRFNHLAPVSHPYMAHCHLLEHEDSGMMFGFTVSK